MATFVVSMGIGCGVLAQDTTITSFAPPASLTWTNRQTNVYYVIDYTWDLSYDWTAAWDPALNIVATSTVTSVNVDELFGVLTNVWGQLNINPPLFYRIASSVEPLSSRYVTNEFMLINASTSTLTSVSLGYQPPINPRTQFTNLVDLAPGASTGYYPFYEPFPLSGVISSRHGAFFNFTQSGEVRDHVLSFFWWGPSQKRIQVTVSNETYTVKCEWLNIQGTMPLRNDPQ